MPASSFEEQLKKQKRKLLCLLGLLSTIGLIGTIAFVALEGVSWDTSFFLMLESVTGAHGFKFVHKTTIALAIVIMVSEWAFIWLLLETIVEVITEGKIKEILMGGYVKKKIKGMKKHYILVGFGRVGSEVVKHLEGRVPFVVVERDASVVRQLCEQNIPAIEGDILNEKTLEDAGIRNAAVLVATVGDDADNVFVTLSAKHLNPRIKIIARAERHETVEKLKQAGATEVIIPSAISGKVIAEATLKLGRK